MVRNISNSVRKYSRLPMVRNISNSARKCLTLSYGRVNYLFGGCMDVHTVGYSYHIKDSYFSTVSDSTLMENKENGRYRPHFFCFNDDCIPGLLWAVPQSTKVEKYQAIQKKKIEKHGSCCTIVLGDFGGEPNAFLIQNMFPLVEHYIDHVHTIKSLPVSLHPRLIREIQDNAKHALKLNNRGINVIFTDIARLKALMLQELT